MMSEMNITKGEWLVSKVNDTLVIDEHKNEISITLGEYDEEYEKMEANAKLIAEAGTVANETGLTPRQLLEQRDELLFILKQMVSVVKNPTENKLSNVLAQAAVVAASEIAIDKADGRDVR
jgi:hypothetical protein